MIAILLSIAFPVCFIVLLIGCLDCLRRRKRSESFRDRDPTDGRNGTAFSVDVCHIPSASDQVTIEPLPDILSKVSTVLPQRPQITCAERGKQETTLTAINAQRSFPRDHLTYLNEIGSGWFGKAIESEAIQIVGGSFKSHVVVKTLKDDASKLEQKQFLDEVTAFRCLDDANIMSLLGQCTETAPFLVILEFAAYGNLKNYLLQSRNDGEEMIASNRLVSFALDAASGLACLQKHGYIHNDLAARNCLVMSDFTLKIGDYGISDHLFKSEYYNTGTQLLPIRWMAPEVLAKVEGAWTAKLHDKTSDMWSFGVLLWEISSLGDRPYDNLTDDAVLQEVVLGRRLLPSDLNIKIPFKDRIWPIMVQCWQNPSERLDVEQAFNNLEQLERYRVDTMDGMSDFDQKWNQLEQNQAITSNIGQDLGSRIALAGSFLTDGSSTSSDKHSVLDEDVQSQDGIKGDDVMINISDEGIHNSRSHDSQSEPTISVHSSGIDPRLNVHQAENIKSSSQDHVTLENELTKTPVSPSHLMSPKSTDQSIVKTSTPVSSSHLMSPKSTDQSIVKTSTPLLQGQSAASFFYSPDSSLSSEYMTAGETLIASSSIEDEIKNSSKDFSLDVDGKTFQETLDEAVQKSAKPSSNVSGFNFPSQTEDEDFSDFVRTSPTAPAIDFTDFASADNNLSAKADRISDNIDFENDSFFAESVVEPATDVAVADNNSFSEFTASAGKRHIFDDDIDTFSDFVTSAPPSKVNSAIVVEAEVNATATNDINDDLAKFIASKDIFPSLGSDLPSDISLISGPEASSQYENMTTSISDPHSQVQEAAADLKLETESSATPAISPEKASTTKVVPDQNQNIFSSENMPADMPSLISDASFLNDDLHLGTSSDFSVIQSQQLETFTDLENSKGISSLESLQAHVPTTTDFLADTSTNIFDVDKNSSAFEAIDFLDEKLQSNLAQPTGQAALHDDLAQSKGQAALQDDLAQSTGQAALQDDKTQMKHMKESDKHDEKISSASEPLFDNLDHDNSQQ